MQMCMGLSSWNVDRFTSNQHQNDQRPILHIVKYISPAETHNRLDICMFFEKCFLRMAEKLSATFQSSLAYK